MVGKVISGSSFSGTVGYVMKEESRILEAEGVMPPEMKDMVQDFKDQTLIGAGLKRCNDLIYRVVTFLYRIIGNEKATVYFQLIARKYRISNNLLQDTKNFWNWQIVKSC